MTKNIRICLAGSGGGHIRQLLDLKEVWSRLDHIIVTEEGPIADSLRSHHTTVTLPHVAWGQLKLRSKIAVIWDGLRNAAISVHLILRYRPEVIVSSGAGAMFFIVLFGRILGACVVIIESFARFEKPSLFGRLSAPLAHHVIIQSERLKTYYPGAHVFDPLVLLPRPAPKKQAELFGTVGATLPFDRLVDTVLELKALGEIPEEVLLQTNRPDATEGGVRQVSTLSFEEVQNVLSTASIVVCHGGTGSIITALREGCHVIAMPRLAKLGEHYDDHQSEISEALAIRGLIQIANSSQELSQAIMRARGRPRTVATTDPTALRQFLDQLLQLPRRERKRLNPLNSVEVGSA